MKSAQENENHHVNAHGKKGKIIFKVLVVVSQLVSLTKDIVSVAHRNCDCASSVGVAGLTLRQPILKTHLVRV